MASIEDVRNSLCRQSEGKARFKDQSGNHLFNFESELSMQHWKLFIDVPFKGQEDLILDLPQNVGAARPGIAGSAAKKLVVLLKRDPSLSRSFDVFLKLVAGLLNPDSNVHCQQEQKSLLQKCRFDTMTFELKSEGEQLLLSHFFQAEQSLNLQLAMIRGDQGLKRMNVTMQQGQISAVDLSLFMNRCVVSP